MLTIRRILAARCSTLTVDIIFFIPRQALIESDSATDIRRTFLRGLCAESYSDESQITVMSIPMEFSNENPYLHSFDALLTESRSFSCHDIFRPN
jgi:hypothetical protein